MRKDPLSRRRWATIAAAALTVSLPGLAQAAVYYWDGNGTTAGAGSAPTGTWNTALTSWTTDSTGTIAPVAWVDGANTAVFAAGTDAVSAYTVTVASGVTTSAIVIEEVGTLVMNGGTVTIGGGTIDASAIGTTTGKTVTVSTALAGSGGLTINSFGNMSASGGGNTSVFRLANTNTFTGDVAINSGLVGYTSDSAFGAGGNQILLNGGGLIDTNQSLTVSRTISVGPSGGTFRAYGSTSATYSGALLGAGNINKTDTGTITLSGSAVGYSGTLTSQAGAVRVTNTDWQNAIISTSTGKVYIAPATTGATVNLGQLYASGDIFIDNSALLNVTSGTVNFGTGGFWIQRTSGTGTLTTQTGTLTLTNGVVTGNLTTTDQEIKATIADYNISTPLTLVKNGRNDIILTISNTYTGGTVINDGRLQVNTSGAAFGTGTVTVNGGGQAFLSGAFTVPNNFVIAGNGVTEAAGNLGALRISGGTLSGNVTLAADSRISSSGSAGTLSGNLIGTNALNIGGTTTGSTIRLTGSNTAFTGAVTVGGNTASDVLQIGNNTASGGLVNVASLTLSTNAKLLFNRSDTVNTSAMLPSTLTFVGTNNTVEVQNTSTAGNVVFDQDMGVIATSHNLRLSGGQASIASGADLIFSNVNFNNTGGTNIGTLNILPGGTLTTRFMNIGDGSGGNGIVNQSGGTVTLASGGSGIRIGHWTNSSNPASYYNLSGGVLDATALSANGGNDRYLNIGWDGSGSMTVGGGASAAIAKAQGIFLDVNGNGGGLDGGVDTLTISSNGVVEVGTLGITGASNTDQVFLNGGTLRATATSTWGSQITANTNTSSTLDFNGQAVTFTNNLLGSGTVALSGGGTATFSTSGAQTVAFALTGTNPVAKVGAGTTTFSGTGDYSGTVSVTAGAANVTGNLSSSNLVITTGAANIAAGGTAGNVSIANNQTLTGEGSIAGTLTLGGGTGLNLAFDPNTPGALTVNELAKNGSTTVSFATNPTVAGPFTLFNYTTLSGTGSWVLNGAGLYRTATFAETGTQVTLDIGNKALTWSGTGGSTWDVATTALFNSDTDTFYAADTVRFDDTATATTVNFSGALRPTSIVVDNSSKNFTWVGSGTASAITGAAFVTKRGTGTLLINNASNTYTGGFTIEQGEVDIQSALGTGTGTVTLGSSNSVAGTASLYFDTNRFNKSERINVGNGAPSNATLTLGSKSSVTGSGQIGFLNVTLNNHDLVFDANAADRTDLVLTNGGSGNVLIKGAGRTVFSASNSFVGNLTISTTGSGALQTGVASSGSPNFIPDDSNVTVSSGAIWNLSMTGNEGINGLSGAGTIGLNSTNSRLILGSGAVQTTTTYTGALNDSGSFYLSLTKNGTGTQVLGGTGSYTGGIVVNAGVLGLTSDAALGNANGGLLNLVVTAGGTGYTAAPTVTITGNGTGAVGTATLTTTAVTGGTVTTAGSGYTLFPTITYSAAAGSGAAARPVLKGQLTLNGGTVRTDASINVTHPIWLLASSNIDSGGFSSTISGQIGGTVGFTKTGLGTLTLTNATNAFTGPLTIAGGHLAMSTIPNGGTNSIIGNSSSQNTNLIINGGTLAYTGTSATTNHAFSTGASGGGIDVATGTTLTFAPTAGPAATYQYSLAGLLVKSGGGDLLLNNVRQTYVSGTTTVTSASSASATTDLQIDGGRLLLNAGYFNTSPFGFRGISAVVNSGGSLVLGASHALGGDNIDSGTSWNSVTVNAGGFLTAAGDEYVSGGLNGTLGRLVLNGGTVNFTGGGNLRSVDAGSQVTVLANASTATISAGVNVRGNFTFDVGNGAAATDLLISGAISAGTSGGIIKTGAGFMAVTNSNNYTGGTQINGGGLSTASAFGLGTGTVTIGTGATTGLQATAAPLTIANNSAVALANAIVLPAPGSATSYTILKNSASPSTGTELALNGTITGGNANLTLYLNSSSGSDNTTSYKFAGSNSFAGSVRVNRGVLVLTNANSVGSATIVMDSNANTTAGNLRFDNSMTLANNISMLGTYPVNTNANTVTLTGTVTGAGGLTKLGAGNLILNNTNGYTGNTTVSNGTLTANNTSGSATGLGTVIVSGATLAGIGFVGGKVQLNGSATLSSTGTLTLNDTLTATGTGNAIESGSTIDSAAVSITGSLTVNGTLLGSGSVTVAGALGGSGTINKGVNVTGGSISPGNSPGILTIAGDVTMDSGSSLNIEIGGATEGTGYDQLKVDGTGQLVTMGGTLNVSQFGGYVPSIGEVYYIVKNDNSNGLAGSFTGLASGDVYGTIAGQTLMIYYNADADTNNPYGGGNDVALLVVPEPAMLGLLSIGALGLMRRRRRAR